jgi:hypothetical protein
MGKEQFIFCAREIDEAGCVYLLIRAFKPIEEVQPKPAAIKI